MSSHQSWAPSHPKKLWLPVYGVTGGAASPDGHILNSNQSSRNAPTMYAMSLYCLMVELEAIEREW